MTYENERLKDLEDIDDTFALLQKKLESFHNNYGDLYKYSATRCDTTNLYGFSNDLDGFKADEVEPMLEEFRAAAELEDDQREYEYGQRHIAIASASLRARQ